MADLELDGVSAAPGTKAHGLLQVAEHMDGSPERIPFTLVNGATDGPTLWITACEHGDETLAAAAVIEFVSTLDPAALAGQVVAMPVLNSTAFNVKHRFSPLDWMDFSRAYPGFANGWLAQQVTSRVMPLMTDSADYVINVHNGMPGFSDITPYIVVSYSDEAEWTDKLQGFVESFMFKNVIHWIGKSTERGERTSTMMTALMAKGIPNFVPEVGPDFKTGIPSALAGFENTLRYLGMLSGDSGVLDSYVAFPDVIHIFPTRGGVFIPNVDLDDEVRAGQTLASIRGFRGEITEELTSPADGVVVAIWRNPMIGTGDFSAFEIATYKEFDQPWPGER